MTEGVRSVVEKIGYQIEEFGCVDGIGVFTGLYGRVNENVVPAASIDSTWNVPPRSLTNAFDILNPSPAPS